MAERCGHGSGAGAPGGAASDGGALGELLRRSRRGDAAAARELVQRCTPMVRAVARRHLRDPGDVEDVVQEAWLALAQHADTIETPEAVRGWLVRVTVRAAWRQARRRTRAVPVADVADRAAADDTEAAGTAGVFRSEATAALDAALGRLRAGDRRLLEMSCADDRPDYRRIGRALDRPVGSIGPTRQRALARLRSDGAVRALVE